MNGRTVRWVGFHVFAVVLLVAGTVMPRGSTQAQGLTYHTYGELVAELTELASDYPSIASMESLSETTEGGRTIWALKISDNVSIDEDEARVLFIGTHHAREWISVEVPFLLAKHLVASYGTDAQITSMIDNEEIWIVPVLNPDGYVYSWEDNRDWRKNRRHNGFFCSLFDNGWGVDLNRNYGAIHWGTVGASGNCTSLTYQGPDPFSEPETQAVHQLMEDHEFSAVLSYHSFSQLILYPWGYTKDAIAVIPDRQLMSSMASEMERLIEAVPDSVDYTAQQSSQLYLTSGDLTDWSYERHGIPSFTIELRPCSTCYSPGFELPASQIEPTWSENKPAALFLVDFFNLKVSSPTPSKPAFAGSAAAPTKIGVIVDGVWRGKTKDDFTVRIGGQNAVVVSAVRLPETGSSGLQNAFQLQVQPPTQASEGTYDLEVFVGDASHQVPGAVLYGEQSNVDVVLVIDRSGSMSGQKISDAKNAAKQFVDFMTDGDKIGVVSFSSSATVNYGLTTVTGAVKQSAKAAIDSIYASGLTSIGAGLQTGGNELVTKGSPSHPWAIVLLSNGGENQPPWVSSILPGIKAAGIVVHSIALGSSANEALMRDIAAQTGGTYHAAPTSQELADIYSAISATVAGQETLLSESLVAQQGFTVETGVAIDSSVTEATFSIAWGGSDLDLNLVTPSGIVIDPVTAGADPDIEFGSASTYEFYRVLSPEAGPWTMRIEGIEVSDPEGEPFTARVDARTQLLMDLVLEGGALTEDPIKVIVGLADSQPIAGAAVTCLVEPPSPGATTTIVLYDDGNHGDGMANDGVYATYYEDTDTAGSYQFTARASGTSSAGEAFSRERGQDAFVKQRPAVTVDVVAPPDVEAAPGSSYAAIFTIVNLGGLTDTFDLIVGPVETYQWADLSTIPDSVSVGAGASVEIPVTINVPPAEEHPIGNSLSLIAVSQTEPLVRDSDSTMTTVPHADLFVAMQGPPTSPIGSFVEYNISYGNYGPANAVNVVLALEQSPDMEYVGDTLGDSVILPDGSRGWFLSLLDAGYQDSFVLTLRSVPSATPGTISVTNAAIGSGLTEQGSAAWTPDPEPDDNAATVSTELTAILVDIDIKPGGDPNSINLGSKGVVPVAVLTTDEFDASTVDPVTVLFAGAAPVQWAMEDVDLDGDVDLILHFKTRELDLNEYSTEATLTGQTFEGQAIQGTDTVIIVP